MDAEKVMTDQSVTAALSDLIVGLLEALHGPFLCLGYFSSHFSHK